MSKLKVSIIGASGFTGLTLLKILLNHPNVEIAHLNSQSSIGKKISAVHPQLQGLCNLKFSKANLTKISQDSDVVFLALPHGESQKIAQELIKKTKVIDLSADFRLTNLNQYEKFYHKHQTPQLSSQFTYGLPENLDLQISQAKHISNPGCFACVSQLSLLPIKNFVDSASIHCITGSTGSGKTPTPLTHHPIRSFNCSNYKINSHRHIPEITQSTGIKKLNFVPTSGPFAKGIHLTAFAQLSQKIPALKMFKEYYKNAAFIRIKEKINLTDVIGTNFCDLKIIQNGKQVIIEGAIDNLIKGAAGNAVQNFNILNNLPEKTGLHHLIPALP